MLTSSTKGSCCRWCLVVPPPLVMLMHYLHMQKMDPLCQGVCGTGGSPVCTCICESVSESISGLSNKCEVPLPRWIEERYVGTESGWIELGEGLINFHCHPFIHHGWMVWHLGLIRWFKGIVCSPKNENCHHLLSLMQTNLRNTKWNIFKILTSIDSPGSQNLRDF